MPRTAVRNVSIALAMLGLAVSDLGFAYETVNLEEYEKQVHSQSGEDGIIEKIFELIDPTTKYAVEFGVGDGLHGSNVRRLYERGWRGLQIEGDPAEYAKLLENCRSFP